MEPLYWVTVVFVVLMSLTKCQIILVLFFMKLWWEGKWIKRIISFILEFLTLLTISFPMPTFDILIRNNKLYPLRKRESSLRWMPELQFWLVPTPSIQSLIPNFPSFPTSTFHPHSCPGKTILLQRHLFLPSHDTWIEFFLFSFLDSI